MTAFPLQLYRGVTAFMEFGGPAFLRRRQRHGKEDASRIGERLGHATIQRPEGPLAWLHGASVGEGLSLLPLIERLIARGFHVMVTTGTVTSSRVLKARLPPGAFHQFVPLDLPRAADRFVSHWRPDVVCFSESELWPNLIGALGRQAIPTVLVNARMSDRSFARWRRAYGVVGPLLQPFAMVLAQSREDAHRFAALGARQVQNTGNLKFDVSPPEADAAELTRLRSAVSERPLWLAASTHVDEEAICLDVHRRVAESIPGLLTILVPRKIARGPAIAAHASADGSQLRLRSQGEPIDRETGVYVADTIGDLGLFYRLAPIALIGKSLTADGGGGQNPIEPAKLGCAILHGTHVANFSEVYRDLDARGGAASVADAADLAATLGRLIVDAERQKAMTREAAAVVEAGAGATARVMAAIEPICAAILVPASS